MANILIIDDDPLVRGSLREILSRSGHDCQVAMDGAEGLSLHRANPCDLVITDILMPGMEGLETLAAMLKESPRPRVITISGGGRSGSLEFLKSSKLLGADATLVKPFTGDELLSTIQDVLGGEATA